MTARFFTEGKFICLYKYFIQSYSTCNTMDDNHWLQGSEGSVLTAYSNLECKTQLLISSPWRCRRYDHGVFLMTDRLTPASPYHPLCLYSMRKTSLKVMWPWFQRWYSPSARLHQRVQTPGHYSRGMRSKYHCHCWGARGTIPIQHSCMYEARRESSCRVRITGKD